MPRRSPGRSEYVLDSVQLATSVNEAAELGLDVDGDQKSDNSLGKAIVSLDSVVDLDSNAALETLIRDGSIIVLAELDASNAAATFRTHFGADPSVAPCQNDTCARHLDGETSFNIGLDSPTESAVVGRVDGASFSGGPGTLSLKLHLAAATAEPIYIDLAGAKVEIAEVTEEGLFGGRIGGGVPMEQIEQEWFPSLAAGYSDIIDTQCEGAAPQPCGCPNDSLGAEFQEGFDADDDCVITGQELASAMEPIFQPDLDLFDDFDNFDPIPPDAPGYDPESMSLGIGFSAVGAAFDSPNE